MLTFGSLFAGIGGLDLGLERSGMRCAWQVEQNDFRRAVLAKHWPNVRRFQQVESFPPAGDFSVGLVCGGPPCQRTSTAAAIQGKRTGETLWPEMLRIVCGIRPRFVVVEQPAGNAKWEAEVAAGLEGAGYRVARVQLKAADCRAPHSRRRVFFVADAVQERCEARAWESGPSPTEFEPWPAPPGGTWRSAWAGRNRMDDGFPGWVDRLEALGDAVVPQCAEWIGRRIIESLTTP